MQEWINTIFNSHQFGIPLLAASFLFGSLSAVISGCNIAALGAVASFATARENRKRQDLLFTSLGFVAGTILALALIGILIGLTGQVVGTYLQSAGRLLAGVFAISFGVISLDLLPFKLKSFKVPMPVKNKGLAGAMLFGFTLGGRPWPAPSPAAARSCP